MVTAPAERLIGWRPVLKWARAARDGLGQRSSISHAINHRALPRQRAAEPLRGDDEYAALKPARRGPLASERAAAELAKLIPICGDASAARVEEEDVADGGCIGGGGGGWRVAMVVKWWW